MLLLCINWVNLYLLPYYTTKYCDCKFFHIQITPFSEVKTNISNIIFKKKLYVTKEKIIFCVIILGNTHTKSGEKYGKKDYMEV